MLAAPEGIARLGGRLPRRRARPRSRWLTAALTERLNDRGFIDALGLWATPANRLFGEILTAGRENLNSRANIHRGAPPRISRPGRSGTRGGKPGAARASPPKGGDPLHEVGPLRPASAGDPGLQLELPRPIGRRSHLLSWSLVPRRDLVGPNPRGAGQPAVGPGRGETFLVRQTRLIRGPSRAHGGRTPSSGPAATASGRAPRRAKPIRAGHQKPPTKAAGRETKTRCWTNASRKQLRSRGYHEVRKGERQGQPDGARGRPRAPRPPQGLGNLRDAPDDRVYGWRQACRTPSGARPRSGVARFSRRAGAAWRTLAQPGDKHCPGSGGPTQQRPRGPASRSPRRNWVFHAVAGFRPVQLDLGTRRPRADSC